MSSAKIIINFDNFEQLNALRCKRIFTDVILSIGDREFPANKIVLCSMSDFFLSMFTSEFIEKNSSFVCLRDIDSDVFEQILEYGYTGKIIITEDNALNIFVTSSYLLIDHLKKESIKFLMANLKNKNFVQIYHIAISHCCDELADACLNFWKI